MTKQIPLKTQTEFESAKGYARAKGFKADDKHCTFNRRNCWIEPATVRANGRTIYLHMWLVIEVDVIDGEPSNHGTGKYHDTLVKALKSVQ